MIAQLALYADELLTTTRTVRKRPDLTRPVEREAILDHAPSRVGLLRA
jgi:hypothetical protein